MTRNYHCEGFDQALSYKYAIRKCKAQERGMCELTDVVCSVIRDSHSSPIYVERCQQGHDVAVSDRKIFCSNLMVFRASRGSICEGSGSMVKSPSPCSLKESR